MAARTVEERIAIIDEKISKKKAEIEALETQKQKPLASLQRKSQKNSVLKCNPKILNG